MGKLLHCLLVITGLFLGNTAFSQQDDQKKFDWQQYRHERDSLNAGSIGHLYIPFDLIDQDKRHICTASSMGKVTLFVFWEPTAQNELSEIKTIYNEFANNTKFQMVIVTFDTTGFQKTLTDISMSVPYTIVREVSTVNDMDFRNGTPTFVLLDKNLIVSKICSPWEMGGKSNIAEVKNIIKNLL